MQANLAKIRAAIQAAAPGATERTDYFQMPGYSYPGYGNRANRTLHPPPIGNQ
jgi:hypothetical protein